MSDPLSDILRLTEAQSVIAGGIAAGGRWAMAFPPPGALKFSALVRGSCSFRLDGQKKAIRAEEGDVVLLPGNRGFTVGSDLARPPLDAVRFMQRKTGVLGTIGDGSELLILAGGVILNPATADLLRGALPPLIHVKGSTPEAQTVRWIMEQLVAEAMRPGSAPGSTMATSMLAQLLFVQILRAHLATAPTLPAGVLRALRDERLGPALQLMHAEPSRDWQLVELARAAGMSRTTFAVRFKEAAGVAPLHYLAEWRIRLAQRRLRDDATPVSEIAASLGYSSESAFSQAFKRLTGIPPRNYRISERARQ